MRAGPRALIVVSRAPPTVRHAAWNRPEEEHEEATRCSWLARRSSRARSAAALAVGGGGRADLGRRALRQTRLARRREGVPAPDGDHARAGRRGRTARQTGDSARSTTSTSTAGSSTPWTSATARSSVDADRRQHRVRSRRRVADVGASSCSPGPCLRSVRPAAPCAARRTAAERTFVERRSTTPGSRSCRGRRTSTAASRTASPSREVLSVTHRTKLIQGVRVHGARGPALSSGTARRADDRLVRTGRRGHRLVFRRGDCRTRRAGPGARAPKAHGRPGVDGARRGSTCRPQPEGRRSRSQELLRGPRTRITSGCVATRLRR